MAPRASEAILAQFQLYVENKAQLLICTSPDCGYALSVARSQLTSHLREKHQIPETNRRLITRHLTQHYPEGFRDPAEATPLEDGLPACPVLRILKGYSCCACPYRTVNWQCLTRHVSHVHLDGQSTTQGRLESRFHRVYLQSWTYKARGSEQQYWIVRLNGKLSREDDPIASAHLRAVHERELQCVSQSINAPKRQEALDSSDIAFYGPWIERTKWNTTYDVASRPLLQTLASIPKHQSRLEALQLPSNSENPTASMLISAKDHKRKITAILPVVDIILDQYEETIQQTGYRLLQWLRSNSLDSCYPRPFKLVGRAASRRRYRRTFKQFLTFIFRSFQLPSTIGHERTRLHFTEAQTAALREVWDHKA